MTGEYWTTAELRAFLKLERPTQYRTWHRVQPLFAPALVLVGTHRLYQAAKVRELMEGRFRAASPMSRSTALRRVG